MKMKEEGTDVQLIDSLIKNYKSPDEIFGKDGLFKQFKKAILERMLETELSTELGYDKHEISGKNSGNSRNGHSEKTLKGEDGKLLVRVPRDRNGEFEPKILPKHQTRFDGFDDKILSLYARGMSTRDIQEQLKAGNRVH